MMLSRMHAPRAPIAFVFALTLSAPVHNGIAYWIKVSAQADGSFTVTNARNGFSKTYSRSRYSLGRQRYRCSASRSNDPARYE
jgi:hypothetical protein